jgi:hypothetical protein
MHSSDKTQISRSLRLLSPRRNTTQARNIEELIDEQQTHFGIDPSTPFGKSLTQIVRGLYESQAGIDDLWKITMESIATLETKDRIARFNAKKFLSFQLAKLIDTLQNPFRKSYQSLNYSPGTLAAKGPYPIFDNVTALFSATPVIARTATYIYACAEWVEDALRQAGIDPTTIRIALGDEDSRDLIVHFIEAARLTLDSAHPGFSDGFMSIEKINALIEETSMDVQRKYVQSKLIPDSVQQPRSASL